jgi:pilus assembly protein CpaE
MTIIFEMLEGEHLAVLLGEAVLVDTPESLVERVNADPEEILVVLGPNISIEDALGFADQCRIRRPMLGVVLLRDEVNVELMADALRAGIREVVRTGDHAAILAACARSQDISRQLIVRQALLAASESGADASGPQVMIEGQVVTVFSAKGGCGKTTIATNLAVALAEGGKRRVCLIDLDLAFGDVAIMLQLSPERTIADAIGVADRLDDIGFRMLLTSYRPGIEVLMAPVQPMAAERIGRDLVTEIIQMARSSFDYVVVDTASAFSEQILAALDVTHHYVLVATPELPSLKNLRVTLDTFELLDYRREARTVVLNRSDSKVGLTMADIEKVLRVPIAGHIPSSRDVPLSANNGVPLMISHPNHPVSAAIKELAKKRLVPDGKRAKRGFFSRGGKGR